MKHFYEVLTTLGAILEPTPIKETTHWDFWVATYRTPVSSVKGAYLYLKSKCPLKEATTENLRQWEQMAVGGANTEVTQSFVLTDAGGAIDVQYFHVTFTGEISGTGDLHFVGSGWATLAAINTYTGQTIIDNGAVEVSGSISQSNVVINPNGFFTDDSSSGTSVQSDAMLISSAMFADSDTEDDTTGSITNNGGTDGSLSLWHVAITTTDPNIPGYILTRGDSTATGTGALYVIQPFVSAPTYETAVYQAMQGVATGLYFKVVNGNTVITRQYAYVFNDPSYYPYTSLTSNFKVVQGSGSAGYVEVADGGPNGDGLDYNNWYWTVQVDQVTLNSITATSSDSSENTVTATSGDTEDLYIEDSASGTDQGAGQASISLSADYSPSDDDAPDTGEQILWTATAATGSGGTSPAHGDFSDDADANITFAPDATRDFVIQAGVDLNQDGILEANEVTSTINVHVVKVHGLNVSNDADPTDQQDEIDGSDTEDDLYVSANSSGQATIDIEALFDPSTSGAGGHVVWHVTGDSSNITSGNFGTDDPHVTLDGSGGNSDFTVQVGFDTNGDGDWDADDHMSYTMNVHLVYLQDMTATSQASSDNAVTVATSTPDDLYIEDSASGTDQGAGQAAIILSADFSPTAPDGSMPILWTATAATGSGGTSPTHGDFINGDADITFAPDATRDFIIKAGVDINGDNTLEDNEVTRTINVHVVKVNGLTVVEDDNIDDGSNTDNQDQLEGSTTTGDFYLPTDVDGNATFDLSPLYQNANDANVPSHLVWDVEDSSGTTIDGGTFTPGEDQQIVLTPTDDDYDFTVQVGFDTNGNQQFDSEDHVSYTENVHTLSGLLGVVKSDGSELTHQQAQTTGGYVLLDNDDDNYALDSSGNMIPDNSPSKTSIAGEKDLVALNIHALQGNAPSGYYVLTSTSSSISLWENSDKSGPVTYALQIPADYDTQVFVEGVSLSAGAALEGVRLTWVSTDGKHTLVMDTAQYTVYSLAGAHNVTDESTFTYTASVPGGALSGGGTWTDGDNSYLVGGQTATETQVLWGVGPAVGKLYYSPAPGFTGELDANIVHVVVTTSTVNPPTGAAVSDPTKTRASGGTYLFATASGNLTWANTITLEGPVINGVTRGIQFINVGYVQTVKLNNLSVTYANGSTLTNTVQGNTYTDMATSGSTLLSTWPWEDSTNTQGIGYVTDSSSATVNLNDGDKPELSFPKMNGTSLWTNSNIQASFTTMIVVQTRDPGVNLAAGDNPYYSIAQFTWSVNYSASAVIVSGRRRESFTATNALTAGSWNTDITIQPLDVPSLPAGNQALLTTSWL